jgi:dynein heavy chain
MQNKMISQLHFEIVQYRTQIFDRFEMLNTTWIKRGKFKDMFDKNKLSSITKQLEKMQSTQEIENIIGLFKQTKQNFIAGSNEQSNIIVTIDTSEVKQASIDMVDKWLEAFGEILKKMANTELRDIIRDTQDYEKALKGEMGDIEQLKALLNVISEIKNKSMDMEFRIIEVQEQFRVLRMHDFEIEEETQKDVDELMTKWEDLLEFADRQDYGVNDFKKNFAEVTKQEVESFKTKIIAEHEKYTTHGPGTIAVGLEEGSQLLAASKDQIKRFNKEREEKVLAEKLFNLPISKFPELVAMEELNKKYD